MTSDESQESAEPATCSGSSKGVEKLVFRSCGRIELDSKEGRTFWMIDGWFIQWLKIQKSSNSSICEHYKLTEMERNGNVCK